MKSPFPGMDPFIEACGLWEDFHNHFIEKIYDSLADSLPSRYLVRTGERGYVVLTTVEGEKAHGFKPDVTLTSPRDIPAPPAGVALAAPSRVEKPIIMQAFIEDEFRETFVEIREFGSEDLVTCIEVLSPSNKRPNSEGWNLYQRKRQGLLLGRLASLVEIDLVRGGERMPMVQPWPTSPFSLLVARAKGAPQDCEIWPAYIGTRLPPLPVPLLTPDPDVVLDLQPMIDTIYARARYRRSLDYIRPLTPPLGESETAFLKQPSQ